MIKVGKNGDVYVASFVKHELLKDLEVTKFSIFDTYIGLDKQVHRIYFVVTVWEDLPLINGGQVKILYMNDFTTFQMRPKDPDKPPQLYFSFSAKVEVIS